MAWFEGSFFVGGVQQVQDGAGAGIATALPYGAAVQHMQCVFLNRAGPLQLMQRNFSVHEMALQLVQCNFLVHEMALQLVQCNFLVREMALQHVQCNFLVREMALQHVQCNFLVHEMALQHVQCNFLNHAGALRVGQWVVVTAFRAGENFFEISANALSQAADEVVSPGGARMLRGWRGRLMKNNTAVVCRR